MKEKHKNSFEFVNKKILKEVGKKDEHRLYKYRRIRREIPILEDKVEELKLEMNKIKEKIKKKNEQINHIFSQIEYLKSDYDFKISIICNKKKYGNYWNINVKHKRNLTKSIYLGSDKKIREFICKRNDKDVSISDKEFGDLLYVEFSESVKDWCIENKDDLMNRTIKMEDLLV